MEKKELAKVLSEVLMPIGFKKKGNFWVINGVEITKMVNIQKSKFGNYFYINYGYILNSVPLNGMTMHIYKRVASLNKDENLRIDELLNLESNICDEVRAQEIKKLLNEKLVNKIIEINSEIDILNELKKLPHLNDIPLVIKRHYNLPE